MVDVDKLRRLTNEAIDHGRKRLQEELEKKLAAQARKQEVAEQKAQTIIDQIPERAEREALVGRDHAIIMNVEYDEFSQSGGVVQLKGAAKLVHDYCVEANLKPTIEYWDDEGGYRDGHNIVIHW